MKKTLICLLLCSLFSLTLTACGNKAEVPKTQSEIAGEADPANSTEDTEKEPEEEEPIVPPVITEQTLHAEIASDKKINLKRAHWDAAAFKLGDVKYSLPFSYARISKNWTFNPADYGYEGDFTLGAYEKTTPTIELEHKNHDCLFKIGLRNPSNAEIDPSLAQVWAASISIRKASSYPPIKLPGGITWGSSIVDVVLAYGTPQIPVARNEKTGLLVYKYKSDYDVYYTLILDEKKGLVEFSYENFNY